MRVFLSSFRHLVFFCLYSIIARDLLSRLSCLISSLVSASAMTSKGRYIHVHVLKTDLQLKYFLHFKQNRKKTLRFSPGLEQNILKRSFHMRRRLQDHELDRAISRYRDGLTRTCAQHHWPCVRKKSSGSHLTF